MVWPGPVVSQHFTRPRSDKQRSIIAQPWGDGGDPWGREVQFQVLGRDRLARGNPLFETVHRDDAPVLEGRTSHVRSGEIGQL